MPESKQDLRGALEGFARTLSDLELRSERYWFGLLDRWTEREGLRVRDVIVAFGPVADTELVRRETAARAAGQLVEGGRWSLGFDTTLRS